MIFVVKATGEKEAFSEEKLRRSIHRAGVSDSIQDEVVAHIKERLFDGIKTSDIYHHITEFLGAKVPYARSKYSLKHAIMSLGPTGFPFEDFIARILQTQGYQTQVRSIITGECISHEIDVIAQKNSDSYMIEAKYHNLPGNKTNVHVSLYTKARFDDVKEKNHFTQAWIITNTHITSDALTYAEYNKVKITSWSYPEGESLRELVEQSGLTPITAIANLSQSHQQMLLSAGIVTSKDIVEKPDSLLTLNLSKEKTTDIINEATFLTGKKIAA